MNISFIPWLSKPAPSEAMYRKLTVMQAQMYRDGRTKPEDTSIDPMLRDAALAYNRRRYLVIPLLRLPRIGHFAREVEARSELER